MNKLVEEIIKPILESNSNIKKVVGIYGGRFQPFGPHHYKTYKWLTKQVDDAYITTSNIKKPPRHPMNFKEKVRHMSKMGVPSNRIVLEKSPYVAKNLAKKYDKDTTAFVYVFGAKDAGRLGGKYFQNYKKSKGNIKGFEEHGYYLTAPHVSISVGGKEVSGTSMRNLLGSSEIDDSERAKLFKKMFGYFNKGIFQMMVNKFKKLFEVNERDDTMIFKPTKIKKIDKPEWHDGKDQELLRDFELDLDIGDTVLMGKFKNKKVLVKTIGYNEKGDLKINGKSAMRFRPFKKAPKIPDSPFGEEVTKEVIENFLVDVDINNLLDEVASSGGAGLVDDGPSGFMGGLDGYTGRNKLLAQQLGFKVVDYIFDVDIENIPPIKDDLRNDRVDTVTFFPAGDAEVVTPNNQQDLSGGKAMSKWKKHIKKLATTVGMKLIKYMEKDDEKITKKDATKLLRQQKKEKDSLYKAENALTKNWWKDILNEIDFKDQEAFKSYQSKHKMRPSTKVNIAGKDTTVAAASSEKSNDIGTYSELFKKQFKEAKNRLEEALDIVESPKIQKRITETKKNVGVINKFLPTGSNLLLGAKKSDIEKTNIADVIFTDNRQFNFHFETSEMGRSISIEKLANNLKENGWNISKYDSKKLSVVSPDGKKYSIHSKPSKEKSKKQIGEATAYEGIVALSYGIASSNIDEKDWGNVVNDLVKNRTYTTSDGVDVDTLNLREDASTWFSDINNVSKINDHLKNLLSNKKLAVEMGAAKDLMNKLKLPKGTKLKINCEGGLDTDEFRADIVIYAEKPDGEKIALVGSSVKDGSSVQLGQLGPRKAVVAIENTLAGSDERKKAIEIGGYENQIQKLPEKMRDKFREGIVNLKNPEQIHQVMLDSLLESAKNKPEVLYDFMVFNIVGTNPPEGLQGFIYQNKNKVRKIPLPGSDEGDKILNNIKNLYKNKRIRKSEDPKKSPFLMYVDESGKEHPIMKTRTKKTRDGKIERTYIEKGGAGSVLFKLLEGEIGNSENTKESFTRKWWKDLIIEELLLEGGAYGHMAHPFDDKNLTFGDLKKIIELGLGGQLNREDNVTEKLDGQNIMISWKDGKLIAARNKGHIKNGGKTALSAKAIASKFKGRGDIANAFNFAMTDLGKAIKGLSQKQKDKIFDNGHNFMNMEVMWPASSNVIDYDIATLVFHGALKYDDNATVIGEVPGSGRILAGMIQQINQHIQKKYSIGKPVGLTIPKHQDFGKMKKKFLGKLSKLQSKFGMKDNDTLALYHQNWWESFIKKQNKKVSSKVLKGLTKRWAFFDKKYSVANMKKDIKDEKFLEWVLTFDKQNHAKQVKDNMRPFEILFFAVGAEILKNVQGFIAANPDKSVQNVKKKLSAAISDVRSGGDLKKLNRLKVQLDRLNAIGGLDSIVPSEGIVFKYKGNTYKFTGAFAPVNQITGLMSF